MSPLVGVDPQNHPQQVQARGTLEAADDRETRPAVFDALQERFGFTVDVAATADNAKLPRFFSPARDGLAQPWDGERAWCNPPYSDIRPWVEKAWAEDRAELVVMLLPANRTEQGWWHDLVEPFRDRPGSPLTTEFIRGRLRFIAPGDDEVRPNDRPPFGSVLLIWTRHRPDLQGIQAALPLPSEDLEP